jgi:hypothetical protein
MYNGMKMELDEDDRGGAALFALQQSAVYAHRKKHIATKPSVCHWFKAVTYKTPLSTLCHLFCPVSTPATYVL